MRLAPRRPGRGRRRTGSASSSADLTTDRALPASAVSSAGPAHDHDAAVLGGAAACSAWSRHTITVKNDASCSRRPDTATRNMARAMPPSVCAPRGRRSGCRRSSRWPRSWGAPSWCLAGRSARPRGAEDRWIPWHAERPPGASNRANEVGHRSRLPSGLGSGAGLVGGGLAAGGRACQHRPVRSLHPGRRSYRGQVGGVRSSWRRGWSAAKTSRAM